MRNAYLVAVLMYFPIAAHALEDTYICVAEKATGFRFDASTGAWKAASFEVSNSKYIIKRRFPENDRPGAFGVYIFGAEQPFVFCSVDEDRAWLECDDTFYRHLRFSYKNLRFTYYFEGSYSLVPVGKSGNDSFIEIGDCTPVD